MGPQRLQANLLARFFLDRQAIRMPAFRGQVTQEELRALETYIGWLRRGRPKFRKEPTLGCHCHRFIANVRSDNVAIRRLLRNRGDVVSMKMSGGISALAFVRCRTT